MPDLLLIKLDAWKASIKAAPQKEASVKKSMGFREVCLLSPCFKQIKLYRAPTQLHLSEIGRSFNGSIYQKKKRFHTHTGRMSQQRSYYLQKQLLAQICLIHVGG